jgi:predicted N-acetyltransferase YhbS
MNLIYRQLSGDEATKLRAIDRSERIEAIYYHRDGKLELEEEFYDMKGFPPGELDKLVERLILLYRRGGCIIGAFDRSEIVGMAAVENILRGEKRNRLKLDILFVSAVYRKQGIGRMLVELAKENARKMGAGQLYISATPSKNTVDFYLNLGCRITNTIDPELFGLEPEDIHLELDL